jgi:hypothetical protein
MPENMHLMWPLNLQKQPSALSNLACFSFAGCLACCRSNSVAAAAVSGWLARVQLDPCSLSLLVQIHASSHTLDHCTLMHMVTLLFCAVLLQLAAIFEFGGAMLLGRVVTNTIAGGIADPRMFARTPEVYAWGMVSTYLITDTNLGSAAVYMQMQLQATLSPCTNAASAKTWRRCWHSPPEQTQHSQQDTHCSAIQCAVRCQVAHTAVQDRHRCCQ